MADSGSNGTRRRTTVPYSATRFIKISGLSDGFLDTEVNNCYVEHVQLGGIDCGPLSDQGIAAFLQRAENLRLLDLTCLRPRLDKALRCTPVNNLGTILLREVSVTESALADLLRRAEYATCVRIERVDGVTGSALDEIKSPYLQKFGFERKPGSPLPFPVAALFRLLARYPRLEELFFPVAEVVAQPRLLAAALSHGGLARLSFLPAVTAETNDAVLTSALVEYLVARGDPDVSLPAFRIRNVSCPHIATYARVYARQRIVTAVVRAAATVLPCAELPEMVAQALVHMKVPSAVLLAAIVATEEVAD
jgi:hypothetical protein